MPIGGNPGKEVFWRPIVVKIKVRLSKWKAKTLSLAGRICLIKLGINALPLFYLSFCVCKSTQKSQTRFLWGWGQEGRKIAWVRWEKLCRPKQEGGLGIRDLGKFSVALLGKWK